MARFLFAATDFLAHIDWGGLLATSRHLHAHGHEVLWCSGPLVGRTVTAAGLAACEIPVVDPYRGGRHAPPMAVPTDRSLPVELWRLALRGPSDGGPLPDSLARSYALLIRTLVQAWFQEAEMHRSCQAVGALIDRWRPDVVVAEPLMLPGAIAAAMRDIPLASCGYPGALLRLHPVEALDTTVRRIDGIIDRLTEGRQLRHVDPRQLFLCSHDLQIVYFPPEWYGAMAAPASPRVVFVGGGPARPRPTTVTPAPRRVVMAVSSSYLPDRRAIQETCEAVRQAGAVGVIGGEGANRAMNGCWPAHVTWRPWVDYDAELPAADAVVHHGGLGTSHAAVRAGVPQLVLPESVDQGLHAEALARAGAGIVHTGEIRASILSPMLAELLTSPAPRLAAARLAARFAGLGGVPRAADALVTLSWNSR